MTRSREIGWSTEAILLWELQKEAKRAQGIASSIVPTSSVRTPAVTTMSSSGTIAAGKKSVVIATSSDWVGTVLGTSIPADYMLQPIIAPIGDTIGAIPIVITAGSCVVITLT
jgi:hypothetical protein